MALTYPIPTVTAGEYIDVPDWNALADSINFLARPPTVHVYATSHATIANNTDTAVAFNNERRDTANMHDPVTNNNRLIAPVNGMYTVSMNIAFINNATGFRVMWIRRGGITNMGLDIKPAVNGDHTAWMCSTDIYLFANEYIELMVKQTSGGNLALVETPDFSPEMKMRWVGVG